MTTLDEARAQVGQHLAEVPAAYAALLGAAERTRARLGSEHASSLAAMGRQAEQEAAGARARAANEALTIARRTGHLVRRLGADNGEDATAAARTVRLGTLGWTSTTLDLGGEVTLPCVVPLFGAGNVILTHDGDTPASILRSWVWAAMSATAPGQLDLVGYDPRLTGALAPFAPLKGDGALVTASSSSGLDEVLDRLSAATTRIRDEMRGYAGTLVDYRRSTGSLVERLHLVIIVDYPAGFDARQQAQLLDLLRVGPQLGMSFLVSHALDTRPARDVSPEEVLALGETFELTGDVLRWPRHPAFRVTPEPAGEHLDAEVDTWVRAAQSQRGQSVSFDELHTGPDWQESSRDGISFVLGRAGRNPVEIRLGDDSQQKHNILVTGAVGQGKSNLLMVLVHSIAQRYSPQEVQFHLLDFKEGVTLFPLAPHPGTARQLPHAQVIGLESDAAFGLAVLRDLQAEFARRARILKPFGDNLAKYRTATGLPMHRIVVVIDEFQVLLGDEDAAEEAVRLLENIARKGRAYGIHLVLASQSISGITALMAKEDGIFSQFPTRIGLKNSVAESHNVFGAGNDGAARLRARGQAIVNLEYGEITANSTVTIAHAVEDGLSARRADWCRAAGDSLPEPRVFDGAEVLRPDQATLRSWQRHVRASDPAAPGVAILGQRIDRAGLPATVPFPSVPGRNLAILGAGAESPTIQATDDEKGEAPADLGIGTLQGAALSLAMHHGRGGADFVVLNLLDRATATGNGLPEWTETLRTMAGNVREVPHHDLATWLTETEVLLTDPLPRPLYVIAFALDRAGSIERPDMFANRPADTLQRILQFGPALGVHTLAWWTSVPAFRRQVGFGGEDNFNAMLLLRVDPGAAKELLGPFAQWRVMDNRGLLVDRVELPAPMPIVPFSPRLPSSADDSAADRTEAS